MRVLAIGAHPDDLELQCAGTLAMYAQQGHEVYMAVTTNGDKGNFDVQPGELAAIRKAEFEASCAVIGAQPVWIGLEDEYLVNDLDNRLRFVEVIRLADPDLVITHDPNDYHPDHRYTHELVWDALTLAGVHHVKTKTAAANRQAALYFMDNLGGVNFQPTEFVDITEVVEIKKRALACHASQTRIFRDLLAVDLLDVVETTGKFRGYQAGCLYGEGFRKAEAWYRGVSRRLLPESQAPSAFAYRTSLAARKGSCSDENHRD